MSHARRWIDFSFVCLLVIAAGFAGYQQIFSVFAPYDDEGYVMISLVGYLQGEPLYDRTFTQYGPAFYAIHGVFHELSQLPVTHDIVRTKTLAVWLITACLGGFTVFRMTDRRVFGLIGFIMTFLALEKLVLEPGHPQDLCVMLTTLSLLLCTFAVRADNSVRCWVFCALGATTAIVSMLKINTGVYLFLGSTLAILVCAAPHHVLRMMKAALLFVTIALPIVISHRYFHDPHGWILPVVVIGALAAIWQHSRRTEIIGRIDVVPIGIYLTAVVATATSILAIPLLQGTSAGGLLRGVLTQHVGFTQTFFFPVFETWELPIVFGIASAACAVGTRLHMPAARALRILVPVLLLYACVKYWSETTWTFENGLGDRGLANLIICFAPALMWLLVYRNSGDRQSKANLHDFFPRLALAMVAVIQPLIATPIPGTQKAVASVPLILGLLVCFQDLLAHETFSPGWGARSRRWVVGGVALLLCFVLVFRDAYLWHHRQALTPLDLPGTRALHLPASQVSGYHDIVNELRDRCDTFIFYKDGHNSLYFWSQIAPPTSLNYTYNMLTAQQRAAVIASLSEHDRVSVVQHIYPGWPFERDDPIICHILANYQPAELRGSYLVWEPKQPADIKGATVQRHDNRDRRDIRRDRHKNGRNEIAMHQKQETGRLP